MARKSRRGRPAAKRTARKPTRKIARISKAPPSRRKRKYTLHHAGRQRQRRFYERKRRRKLAAARRKAYGARTLRMARNWFIRRYGRETYRVIDGRRVSKRVLANRRPDAVIAAYLAEKRIQRISRKKKLRRREKQIAKLLAERPELGGDISRIRAKETPPTQSYEFDIVPQYSGGRATGIWDLRLNGTPIKHYPSKSAATKGMQSRRETLRAKKWAASLDITATEARALIREIRHNARQYRKTVLNSAAFKKLTPKEQEKMRHRLQYTSDAAIEFFELEHDISEDNSPLYGTTEA